MDTIEARVVATVRCYRCTMSFVVGEPAFALGENHVCPECHRAFWSADNTSAGPVTVGVRVA